MNTKYGIFYHTVKLGNSHFPTAGIKALDDNGNEIKRIYDFSTDFKAVREFVKMLNENDVDICQLYDMADDFYQKHG